MRGSKTGNERKNEEKSCCVCTVVNWCTQQTFSRHTRNPLHTNGHTKSHMQCPVTHLSHIDHTPVRGRLDLRGHSRISHTPLTSKLQLQIGNMSLKSNFVNFLKQICFFFFSFFPGMILMSQSPETPQVFNDSGC